MDLHLRKKSALSFHVLLGENLKYFILHDKPHHKQSFPNVKSAYIYSVPLMFFFQLVLPIGHSLEAASCLITALKLQAVKMSRSLDLGLSCASPQTFPKGFLYIAATESRQLKT